MSPSGLEASALALVADHRWMVRFIAAKTRELRTDAREDLLAAAGDVALLDAATWFVPSRGPSFPRYVWQNIERAVRDALARRPMVARVRSRAVEAFIETVRGEEDPWTMKEKELAALVERECWGLIAARITGAILDARASQPEDDRWAALTPVLDRAIEALSEEDLTVLDMRYREGHTFEQIATKLDPPTSILGATMAHRDALARFGGALRRISRTDTGTGIARSD